MNLHAQIDAFKAKHPDGGMKNLAFTIAFPDGSRTLLAKGNEQALFDTFHRLAQAEPVDVAEADHDTGYFIVGVDVLGCDCGDGLHCDKAKVTSYE